MRHVAFQSAESFASAAALAGTEGVTRAGEEAKSPSEDGSPRYALKYFIVQRMRFVIAHVHACPQGEVSARSGRLLNRPKPNCGSHGKNLLSEKWDLCPLARLP